MKKTKKSAVKKAVKKQTKPVKTVKTAANDSPILKEVKQLYAFMQNENLGTLSYEQKGVQIKIVRAAPAQVAVPVAVGGQATGTAQACSVATPEYKQVIKSPLMGIFFRGSTPSAAPFIREGQSVKAGDVVCLIEAMKVFNEVKADSDCVIKKVLVENGKPIKAGDPLFAIEKI
ncbi:acetyl-CoA carboxylase biotin carboxyl carrier protein [Elusimicrobium simillimum]|uniref:acetyl-CoA carboxylase biotin carboxyl carrier protein n=1 Tax=Elusimicrobium simillimum TaxID=3143438 RepID=UPI003C7048CC